MRITLSITAGPAQGQTFTFDRPDCLLFGRTKDARISIPNDPYVSRQHFLLEIAPPSCKITDLGSMNGLVVNNTRYGGRSPTPANVGQAPGGLKETFLRDGDEIIVGDTRMKLSIELDAACVRCGTTIAPGDREELRYVGGTFLCRPCRIVPPATVAALPMTPPKRTVLCVRCKADVSAEAGPRGLGAGSEYVCKACRERATKNPAQLLDALGANSGQIAKGYVVESVLGQGGMGVVFKATQEATGRTVAIKTILPHEATNDLALRRFQREVEITRQIKHPNVVELLDYGNSAGAIFCVLEFVDGMDLGQWIMQKKGSGTSAELEEIAPLILRILDGLAAAHGARFQAEAADGSMMEVTGIVHRDLKPQNILLARDGDTLVPKIADFGLAKAFESAGLTNHTGVGEVAGTPVYWPREQITHYRYLFPATDVFSIAAVFYEVLTGHRVRNGFEQQLAQFNADGRRPGVADYMRFIAENPVVPVRERQGSIPAPLAAVIDRALRETEVSHDPERMRLELAELRYENAAEFRVALAGALADIGLKT